MGPYRLRRRLTLTGPEDVARGREDGLGTERTEGASWMRRKRRVAVKAFIAREQRRDVGLCVDQGGRSCRRVKRRYDSRDVFVVG